jgi:hypothetical protein
VVKLSRYRHAREREKVRIAYTLESDIILITPTITKKYQNNT